MTNREKLLCWLGIIVALMAGVVLGGWALSVMWGWFIAPIFGLPHLELLQASGIALTVNLLAKGWAINQYNTLPERVIDNLIAAIFWPLVCVGIGWIITWFM